MRCLIASSLFALTLAACGREEAPPPTPEPAAPSEVEVIGIEGRAIGTVTISEDANGATLALSVDGALGEGMHGVHLHETGLCQAPDFRSAGGHWNPTGNEHGRDNPAGAHVGDLANMSIDGAGNGEATYLVAGSLIDGGMHPMADEDGTALVIHAGPDDYVTDPSGDSGARVACAVIAPLAG